MILKKYILPIICLLFVSSLFSATPTAEQISQFQSLPQAQKEQLASQYGIDISALNSETAYGDIAQEVQPPLLEPTLKKYNVVNTIEIQNKSNDQPKPFGYDVLASSQSDFTAVNNLPVPLDYQMGPGDVINVQIFGKSNRTMSLKIGRDGTINIPDLGPLTVTGQTFGQFREQLIEVIKQKIIGVGVSVSMGEMRTMQVYIVGEAAQPGSYNVNALTTITQALIASGGVKESGSLRNIQLKRKGKVISEFDLYDLLLKGDTSKDVRLSSGDTLFIPTKISSVTLEGEVTRPAIYELKGKTNSLIQLLDLVGGVKPGAYLAKVSVRRIGSEAQQFTLNLKNSSDREFLLQRGDYIRLGKLPDTLYNIVTVRGDVTMQGPRNLTEGMRIRDAIGSIYEGLKENADLNYALLVREKSEGQEIEVHQFSLLKALKEPSSADNLLLQQKDQILVFSNGIDFGYLNESHLKNQQVNADLNSSDTQYIDSDTGALIKKEEQASLDNLAESKVSLSTKQRQENRKKLLQPIISRLQGQSTYNSPSAVVNISGSVKFPGTYPLTKNATVESLVIAAGGLNEDAYLDHAELTYRNEINGRIISNQIVFSLEDALNGTKSLSLSPQNHLVIKTKPNWKIGMLVELQGEVVFPGEYTFQRGDTIKDLIDRAGGFTKYAYPEGTVFSRERLKRQEAERLTYLNNQLKQEIKNMPFNQENNSDPQQAITILDQLGEVEPIGRLVINMNEVMKGNKFQNLLLEEGDKLFIPALNPVISVVGEVQYGSHHTFNPNMVIEEYIAASGGTKRRADTGRIYIIKANGAVQLPNNSFWFSRNYKPLEPGDTIIVPLNDDYLNGLSTLSTATQILYQIGVAWSALSD